MILVRVKAKSLLCYWAARDLGIGMGQIARRLNLSLAGVSQPGRVGFANHHPECVARAILCSGPSPVICCLTIKTMFCG